MMFIHKDEIQSVCACLRACVCVCVHVCVCACVCEDFFALPVSTQCAGICVL